jgi:hypothetical protein
MRRERSTIKKQRSTLMPLMPRSVGRPVTHTSDVNNSSTTLVACAVHAIWVNAIWVKLEIHCETPVEAAGDNAYRQVAQRLVAAEMVVHLRYADTGGISLVNTLVNTHPFSQDGRAFARSAPPTPPSIERVRSRDPGGGPDDARGNRRRGAA